MFRCMTCGHAQHGETEPRWGPKTTPDRPGTCRGCGECRSAAARK